MPDEVYLLQYLGTVRTIHSSLVVLSFKLFKPIQTQTNSREIKEIPQKLGRGLYVQLNSHTYRMQTKRPIRYHNFILWTNSAIPKLIQIINTSNSKK
jgi:hypothetical protein